MKISAARTQEAPSLPKPARPPVAKAVRCPACGQSKTEEFFQADNVPVFCSVTFDTAADARRAPRGNIRLRLCRPCGYIYNAAFVPELVAYAPGYENAQHFSEHFRRYAEQLADRLVERLGLRGRRIIEIGCGDGYFLSLLCRTGSNTGIGFDPSCGQEDYPAASGRVSFHSECYGPAHAHEPVDLICCRHVLEHIADPVKFLLDLRETIGGRDHVRLYFEVPNAMQVLRGFAMWDVLYEHCGYFTAPALQRLFFRVGFEPLSTWQSYEGQFLALFARPVPPRKASMMLAPAVGKDVRISIEGFDGRFRRKVAQWQQYLAALHEKSMRAVLWQAGSRGVTLLNALERSKRLVPYVVDINPRKQGRFVAGSAQQVVAPEFLRTYRPAAAIVMNAIYRHEIAQTLRALGVKTDLLIA